MIKKNFLRDMRLKIRINALILSVLFVVFSINSLFIYQNRKARVVKELDLEMQQNLQFLVEIIDTRVQAEGKNFSDSLKNSIHKLFNSVKFRENGFAYLVSEQGKMIIHPVLRNQDVSKKGFFRQLTLIKKGKTRFMYPENENGDWMLQYFRYYEPLKCFVSVVVPEDDVFRNLRNLKWSLIGFMIVVIIGMFFIIDTIIHKALKVINLLVPRIESLPISRAKPAVLFIPSISLSMDAAIRPSSFLLLYSSLDVFLPLAKLSMRGTNRLITFNAL